MKTVLLCILCLVVGAVGGAKFWLTPSVHLAKNVGLSGVQLRQAQAVVEAHIQEIEHAWHRHFGG